ncbi:MAG: hypothetical protein KAR20_23005, partial [Candidatus Heimdallarchaeota archaeon]|nr:hypothetical protein [Candidatus Heimdallarchaeota archaeon]
VRLINECPDCHMPITWNRANVDSCDCGGDFSFAETETASTKVLALVRIIYNSLSSTTNKLEVDSSFPEDIFKMNIASIGKVCSYLGGLFTNGGMLYTSRLHRLPLDERYKIMEIAAMVLADWPHNWHAVIDNKINKKDHAKHGRGLKRVFDKLYEHLYIKENDGDFNFLREGFESHLHETGFAIKITNKGKSRFIQLSEEHLPYMTPAEVMKELNFGKYKLENLIESNQLEEFISPNLDNRVRKISRESIMAYKCRPRGKIVSARQVSSFLGIGLISVMKILESGLIPAVRGAGAKGNEPWRVHKDDVLAFRRRFNSSSKICKKGETAWLFTHRATQSKLNSSGIKFDEFLSGILSGEIQTYRTRTLPARLDCMFFDKENLDLFIEKQGKEKMLKIA